MKVLLLSLLLNPNVSMALVKSEWTLCNQSSECVLVEDICGEIAAINSKFKQEFEKWRDKMRADTFCMPADNIGKMKSICQLKKCVLITGD